MITFQVQDTPIHIWVKKKEDIENGAFDQLVEVAKCPFIFKHVAAMPDVHQGYGITIGGVVACVNAVVPYFVGVDIGCGMSFVRTNIKAKNLTKDMIVRIRRLIKNTIPMGDGKAHQNKQEWELFNKYVSQPNTWFSKNKWKWIQKSLGTLGGGNHFIEIQEDDDGFVCIMLHSGSRNLGKLVCDYHYKIAVDLCHKYYSNIPNDFCSFLPVDTIEGVDYLADMNFCLAYAKESRSRMMQKCKDALEEIVAINLNTPFEFRNVIDVHHNYASLENHMGRNVWVHRKGAIRARKNDIGIIPGSQGTNSYIVRGLENPVAFHSAPHGAGRKMGRNEACKTLNLEEENSKMKDIVFDTFGTNIIKGNEYPNLQEAAGAYKDIDEVMVNASDLVEVISSLKPLGVLKGHDRRRK